MDPYRVLGVGRDATQEDIARAYRSLAVKYHPDKSSDDPDKASVLFKEATAAFELIGSPEKRRRYDLSGGRTPSLFSFKSRNSVDDVFDNLFSQFFDTNQGKGPGPLRSRVKVTLAEAHSGCVKVVNFGPREMCAPCSGTGSTEWAKCDGCGGSGFVFSNDGFVRVHTACAECLGRGSKSVHVCSACNGRGHKVTSERGLDVTIPPGVENGTQIRLSGEAVGNEDVFVVVLVEKDPAVSRHQRDLFVYLEVPYSTLVLGGEASVALFGSKITLKVPKGTKAGARMRVKGHGMPHIQNASFRGDLFVDIVLFVPSVLTKEHEKALVGLAKIEAQNYTKREEKK
jgi:molecular chaperone DnaJ